MSSLHNVPQSGTIHFAINGTLTIFPIAITIPTPFSPQDVIIMVPHPFEVFVDLKWRGSFIPCAFIAMSKHMINLHHISNVKWAHFQCDSAYAATSHCDTINVSHTTLIFVNSHHTLDTRRQSWSFTKSPSDPLSTWSDIRDHTWVRNTSSGRVGINDPRYYTTTNVAWAFAAIHFVLVVLAFSTFVNLTFFLFPIICMWQP